MASFSAAAAFCSRFTSLISRAKSSSSLARSSTSRASASSSLPVTYQGASSSTSLGSRGSPLFPVAEDIVPVSLGLKHFFEFFPGVEHARLHRSLGYIQNLTHLFHG